MSTGPVDVDLTVLGCALADSSRAAMLTALMTGTAWSVGELATHAGIAHSTASQHVQRLHAAGLVDLHRQGRHTYVTLANPEVAAALETLSLLAPQRPAPASLRGQRHATELSEGRTCYRHLAGRLGVTLHDRLMANGYVTACYELTPAGLDWLGRFGIGPVTVRPGSGLRPCLDWTERRPHCAGPVANQITAHAFDIGWVNRGNHPRSVRLTPEGHRRLLA